jgi:Rab-GTPase-TBC domain
MNYVASSLYTDTKDEELTFNIMLSLIVSKDLKSLWCNNVPEYHVRQHMLDQLISEHIPDLAKYFKRLGLFSEVITGQWLMTFFCGYFNHPSILMILDNFFLDDWIAVFRLSLALLKKFKDDLMVSTDIAFVAQFFHTLKEKIETVNVHDLLNESL